MMIDLTKLTPGPWTVVPSCAGEVFGCDIPELPWADDRDARFGNRTDAEFIALARAAIAIIMRRGWFPVRLGDGWGAAKMVDGKYSWLWAGGRIHRADDPFTVLIEADRWCGQGEQ